MKMSKKVFSLAMAVAVAATSVAVPAPTKVDAATSYKAFLCLQTGASFTYRNTHADAKFSNKLQVGVPAAASAAAKKAVAKAKFADTSMAKNKKAKTYTVSLTNIGGALTSPKDVKAKFNTLFVDTSIAGSLKSKVSVKNVKVYFDGKLKKNFATGILTPDPGKTDKFVQIQVINKYNTRVKAFSYTMPKKSIKVTYTISFK